MAKKFKKIAQRVAKKVEKIGPPVETEKIKKIKIRVIGIGSGGGNIVSEIAQKVKRASFFIADTDLKTLEGVPRKVEKFQFGQNLTHGLGTGMNPAMAEEAAMEEKERIKKIFEGQDLVILIASLGGGVGSGASPVFAKISKNLGNLTYGIFTLPFKFESQRKMEIARNSLRKLRRGLNAFTVLPNEKIFKVINRTTPLKKALSTTNKTLSQSLQGLIEVIYKPGLINIDFADLKTVFEGKGRLTYLNSVEVEKGDEKELIEKAINPPFYPYSIEGARGVLFNISGPKELSLAKVSQISKSIFERVSKEAKIIFGISPAKKGGKIKITLLATGCSLGRNEISLLPSKKIFPRKPRKPRPKEKEKRKKLEEKKKVKPPKKEKPKMEIKKEAEIVRKNALALKNETEKEEAEMLAKEKFWETPTFLRLRPTRRPPAKASP